MFTNNSASIKCSSIYLGAMSTKAWYKNMPKHIFVKKSTVIFTSPQNNARKI